MVLSATIGALGSLGAAGIGAISANYQSGKAFNRMISAMREQAQLNYDYGIKSLENSPTAQRKGLETAGYNPMLAVQNANSGANAGWTSQGGYQQDQATDAISNGIRNGTEMAQLAINQQQADAQSDQAYAEADKAKVEKNALLQKMPYISDREKAEINNIEKDSLMKESQIHNIDETTRFIEKEYELRKRLGEMGIAVQRRGQDLSYNASTYASNVSRANNISTNRTTRGSFGLGHFHAFMGVKNKNANKWYDNL